MVAHRNGARHRYLPLARRVDAHVYAGLHRTFELSRLVNLEAHRRHSIRTHDLLERTGLQCFLHRSGLLQRQRLAGPNVADDVGVLPRLCDVVDAYGCDDFVDDVGRARRACRTNTVDAHDFVGHTRASWSCCFQGVPEHDRALTVYDRPNQRLGLKWLHALRDFEHDLVGQSVARHHERLCRKHQVVGHCVGQPRLDKSTARCTRSRKDFVGAFADGGAVDGCTAQATRHDAPGLTAHPPHFVGLRLSHNLCAQLVQCLHRRSLCNLLHPRG